MCVCVVVTTRSEQEGGGESCMYVCMGGIAFDG